MLLQQQAPHAGIILLFARAVTRAGSLVVGGLLAWSVGKASAFARGPRSMPPTRPSSSWDVPSVLPSLVVFDLDATLWSPELYEMAGRPFRKQGDGRIVDRRGEEIDLLPEARRVLVDLVTDEAYAGVKLGLASRTDCVRDAHELMGLIDITPDKTMAEVFEKSLRQIFPGSKRTHFASLQRDTQIPYREMIFFDDWDLNCRDVARYGVQCHHVPYGMTVKVWRRALESYALKSTS